MESNIVYPKRIYAVRVMLTMEASRYLSIASLDTNMTDVLEFSSNPIGIAPIYSNHFFVSGSTYQFQVSLPQFWRDPQHRTCIAARRVNTLGGGCNV